MHVDLCGIRDLLAVDTEQDALKSEAQALATALKDARARHDEAEEARAAAERARAGAVKQERTLNRSLEDYTSKRDRTRTLIDSGGAPDYGAAKKQLDQLVDIVDQLEIDLLEQFDAREEAERIEARAGLVLTELRERVEEAKVAQRRRRPEIEARYSALRSARVECWAALRSEQQSHYAGLRRKGAPVLVDVVDGACSHCHVEPPPQTVVEVLRERRVHTCRSCHCWFRDVRADDGEE
ncbi:MAG: hypothetical protein VX265_10820 [Myxococcota bacterium]|nr:hypothetical protein [Myxococcota bacterium]